MLEQTTRMERLITDLRELVQVEGGRLTLRRLPWTSVNWPARRPTGCASRGTRHTLHIEAPRFRSLVIGTETGWGRCSTT